MSQPYLRRTHCPICSNPVEAATPVVRSNPPAEHVALDAHSGFLSGYTSRRVFFSYSRCDVCGGLYCPRYYTDAQLQQLYGQQGENMAEVPLAAREATQREYFEILRPYAALDRDYLELGPDIGLFARLCADRGRFSRFYLFEPNREVHAAMAERLAGHDVRITTAPYCAGTLPRGSVSTAALIHVLDHLIEPAELLRGLYDDLAPEGTIFIVTHNAASWLARVLGRRWPPYTLQHPQLFAPQTITRLLERCGFQVVEVTKTANYFPLTYLLRSAFPVLGVDRWTPRLDHPFTLRLKLGNIATIGKKPV